MKIRVATVNIAGGALEEYADPCKYKILGELEVLSDRRISDHNPVIADLDLC